MNRFIVFILAGMMASGALADDHSASGDASAGEVAFNKQCVACHVVVTDAGEKLAGRNSKSGPNYITSPAQQQVLYRVIVTENLW